ncbi:MAG: hypothetical protein EHM41_14250 [Chloroflexi bacterium]|nr:MAG: hypothetical protein EHM41_14250 [Chloroflexota bacterium]
MAKTYDRAHEKALKVLESLDEEDFQKQVEYPNWDPALSGQVDIERLFHYIRYHFELHAEQIRQAVGSSERVGGL